MARDADLVPGDEAPRTAGCPGLEEFEVPRIQLAAKPSLVGEVAAEAVPRVFDKG